MGAHLTYSMQTLVGEFVPDAEVAAIKEGGISSLCVWGVITYEDIFGDRHTTKFAQSIHWLADNQTIYGIYIPGQNDSD